MATTNTTSIFLIAAVILYLSQESATSRNGDGRRIVTLRFGAFPLRLSHRLYPVIPIDRISGKKTSKHSPKHSQKLKTPSRFKDTTHMNKSRGRRAVYPISRRAAEMDKLLIGAVNELYVAINGKLVGDISKIIDITVKNNKTQRMLIAETYSRRFRTNFQDDLATVAKGDLLRLLGGLYLNKTEFLARELHTAMEETVTDVDSIYEIMCCLEDWEMEQVMSNYENLYGSILDDDLQAETKQMTMERSFLLALARNERAPESEEITMSKINQTVISLSPALAEGTLHGNWSKIYFYDQKCFANVFSRNSFKLLNETIRYFESYTNSSINLMVENGALGDFKRIITNMVSFIQNKWSFYAYKIYRGFYFHFALDRKPLTRALVTFSPQEFKNIREWYRGYGTEPLEKTIGELLTKDYANAVLQLLNSQDD